MSNCVNVVFFNKNRIKLQMRFDGDDYETASVKFELIKNDYSLPLEEPVTIPVKCLFSMGYLILMSIRRTAVQYEKEAQKMMDVIEQRKHPFEHIGENEDVKKD